MSGTPHSAILTVPMIEPGRSFLAYASKLRSKNGMLGSGRNDSGSSLSYNLMATASRTTCSVEQWHEGRTDVRKQHCCEMSPAKPRRATAWFAAASGGSGLTGFLNRWGPVKYMGEIELENQSADPLEISYQMTVVQYLNIVIRTPSRRSCLPEGHFGDSFLSRRRSLISCVCCREKNSRPMSLCSRRYPTTNDVLLAGTLLRPFTHTTAFGPFPTWSKSTM